MPVALLQTYLDRGITMTQTYSLTEVSASGITLPYDQALERVGSCGVPAMHSEARIVDADDNEVPPGDGRRDRHQRPRGDGRLLAQSGGHRRGAP